MHAFSLLYRTLSRARRRQLHATLALMLLGAFAELAMVLSALAFFTLLIGAGGEGAPSLVRGILEFFSFSDLVAAALLLIAMAIAAGVIRLLLIAASQRFVAGVGHDLAVGIFAWTLHQPYAEQVEWNSAESHGAIERVRDIAIGVLQPGMQGMIASVLALFLFALLAVLNPLAAGGAAASIGGLYLFISRITRRRLRANSSVVARAASHRAKLLQESVGSIRDILLDRSQAVFIDRFAAADAEFRQVSAENMVIAQAPRYIVEAGALVAITVIALILSLQPSGSAATIPVLGAMALGAQRLLPLVQQIYLAWSSSTGNTAAIVGTIELLKASRPETEEAAGELPFQSVLELRDVSYRFGRSAEEAAFKVEGINLLIPAGSRIGIVGRTGSGKSSLLDLIMGLIEPSEGTILVDGVALDERIRPLWQKRIAHVPQSIYLVDDSIAANIAFGVDAGSIDMEKVRACAAAACLAEFVDQLPKGYETSVGDRGVRLSGGQRQRVGIARALYKGAPVLVLDEATSALDDSTEARVMASIMSRAPAMTVIMVAHRQSSLGQCDRVVEMDQGRIVRDAPATSRPAAVRP